ncbi:MAG TPA: hypothetical protein VHA33_03980 [Candidatus Angelobacter sp.]|jgi:hypothetical protein|nr:hypothetical protein [Candidatus Angelobacter sp.]
MTPQRKQSEERLSEALRNLGQASPRNAPPEIYSALAGAFRSHYVRRRRVQRMRMALAAAACLVLSVALLFALRGSAHNYQESRGNAPVHLIPPQQTDVADQQTVEQASHRAAARPLAPNRSSQTATVEDFVALPSYDPTIATDGLRIIRLEASGSDLRLAGAPVREDLSDRRVVADFMVGRDGTPYAVRFVQ